MNYIKQLQADKAEPLDSARSIETEINDLVSYLCCDKFRVDTRVQVGDVLQILLLSKILLHTSLQSPLAQQLTTKINENFACNVMLHVA
jgi:hypothetical protein